MIERIQEIIRREGLNASRFADEIGLQRSNVSHVLSGRNKPSLDFVLRILEHFKEVSAEWLLFGRGAYGRSKEDLFTRNVDDRAEGLKNEKTKDVELSGEQAAVKQTELQDNETSTKKTGIKKVLVLYQDGTFENYMPNK